MVVKPPVPPPEPRWTYHRVAASSLMSIADPAVFDELGKVGWELIGFDTSGAAWFKRKVTP